MVHATVTGAVVRAVPGDLGRGDGGYSRRGDDGQRGGSRRRRRRPPVCDDDGGSREPFRSPRLTQATQWECDCPPTAANVTKSRVFRVLARSIGNRRR